MTHEDARRRRLLARVTQKELAEALRMHRRTLMRYEQGQVPLPSWVTVDELFETIARLDWRNRKHQD